MLRCLLVSVCAAFFCVACDRQTESQLSPREPGAGKDRFAHQIVTGEDPGGAGTQAQWDRFFDTPGYVYGKNPIEFLSRNIDRLRVGSALVLAMGEGRNAVYLARRGFKVDGVDISEVALRKARRLAKEHRVTVNAIQGNIKDFVIPSERYDLIINTVYYRADIIPKIKAGLKRGGFVLFENYTEAHLKNPSGMSIPSRFLVKSGELKERFSGFEIIEYEETNDGKEALARLLARKP